MIEHLKTFFSLSKMEIAIENFSEDFRICHCVQFTFCYRQNDPLTWLFQMV